MSAATTEALRIGEVAKRLGITTRTIRYYEEIGLLPAASERPHGGHRFYTEADIERLRELTRLRDLLGVSLDELRELVEAEDARATLREEFHRSEDPARRHDILEQALTYVNRQLELVRKRKGELETLETELANKRRRIRSRLSAD